MGSAIDEVPALDERSQVELQELIRTAPGAADSPPISERGLLQVRAGHPVRHLVALADRGVDGALLTGYAQLDGAERPATAELVAADQATAGALLTELAGLAGSDGLRLWAHGSESVASRAALAAGLAPVRTLLQLRRSLTDLAADEPNPPAGVRIRPFVVGQDEAAWLRVNARAFAHHPEQGGWTEHDLTDRLLAPWFDPAGFLLAERDGPTGPELVGFHWTKVHNDNGARIGEVYVLGVDPAAQGLRLGGALLDAGLRHLRDAGLDTVLLYVEESNGAAIHLYAKAGFSTYASDIQYALGG
ncbi:MAG TPA: mycothiol synthase [Jatrophihabitans sp.]|nr:mycothiol synthase [Jatrophihabitans sp.]